MTEQDYSQGAAYVYGEYVSLEGAVIPYGIWDLCTQTSVTTS